LETIVGGVMQAEHFRPQDLFAQIQGLVDGLTVERSARDAAEAANKAKTALLAMVGHELRAPMESVISMIDLLKASPLDPAQQRYTDMIVQATQRLVHVLDDVLEYARLEAGGFELDSAPFDLHELLHDVGFELQARASQKGLTNSFDIGASCPRAVAGDAARFRQVLLSLIDNALKFTAEGSVRLRASGIDVDGLWRLRFDVSDTGSGHSRAERELLLQARAPRAERDRQAKWRYRARAGDGAAARGADGRRGRLQQRGGQGQPLLVYARRCAQSGCAAGAQR